jgi:PUA domain protein
MEVSRIPVLRHLKDKEARQIVREFSDRYPASKGTLESVEHFQELNVEDDSVIFADNTPLLIRRNGVWYPSLKFQVVLDSLPKIVVDMGAVPHIANGAQIMRPGIKMISDAFKPGDLVVVQDERFKKAIAIGTADSDSEAIKAMTKGKAVSNVHYVGDYFWNAFGSS